MMRDATTTTKRTCDCRRTLKQSGVLKKRRRAREMCSDLARVGSIAKNVAAPFVSFSREPARIYALESRLND